MDVNGNVCLPLYTQSFRSTVKAVMQRSMLRTFRFFPLLADKPDELLIILWPNNRSIKQSGPRLKVYCPLAPVKCVGCWGALIGGRGQRLCEIRNVQRETAYV